MRARGAAMARRLLLATAATLSLALLACMRAAGPPPLDAGLEPPPADSVTVALWRLDERAGTRVADSGPFRLEGTAGLDTRVEFGRFGGARGFVPTLESFLYVPFNPMLELPWELTIEAWIRPEAFGLYEDTPIAGRWTEQANEAGWLLSLSGFRRRPPLVPPGPQYHAALFPDAAAGHLLFAYQPEAAGAPRGFASSRAVPLDRWSHVAATFDGEIVRLYIDGELDAQYASAGRIRASPAPLLVGNYFDPRTLSRFGGDLRPTPGGDPTAHYAFQGRIDELRISSAARRDFPRVAPR